MRSHVLNYARSVTIIDKLMAAAAVVHPLTALPQVLLIYSTKRAGDLSLVTWLGFILIGLIFLAYAIVHKIKPLIVTQVLWFVVDGLIVAGILLYP